MAFEATLKCGGSVVARGRPGDSVDQGRDGIGLTCISTSGWRLVCRAFYSDLIVAPSLRPEHRAFLSAFCETRRARVRPAADALEDRIREAACLPLGPEGAFCVLPEAVLSSHQMYEDYNEPPHSQPGLWCPIRPVCSERGLWDTLGIDPRDDVIENVPEWAAYLAGELIGPWGYVLNGQIAWQGEEFGDLGRVLVTDNVARAQLGYAVYPIDVTGL